MKLCCLSITDWAFYFRSVSLNTKSICKLFFISPFSRVSIFICFPENWLAWDAFDPLRKGLPLLQYFRPTFSVIQDKQKVYRQTNSLEKSRFINTLIHTCIKKNCTSGIYPWFILVTGFATFQAPSISFLSSSSPLSGTCPGDQLGLP